LKIIICKKISKKKLEEINENEKKLQKIEMDIFEMEILEEDLQQKKINTFF